MPGKKLAACHVGFLAALQAVSDKYFETANIDDRPADMRRGVLQTRIRGRHCRCPCHRVGDQHTMQCCHLSVLMSHTPVSQIFQITNGSFQPANLVAQVGDGGWGSTKHARGSTKHATHVPCRSACEEAQYLSSQTEVPGQGTTRALVQNARVTTVLVPCSVKPAPPTAGKTTSLFLGGF